MKNKLSTFFNYLLVSILIGISGSPYFAQYEDNLLIMLFSITIPVLIYYKRGVEFSFILFIVIFSFITYIQLVTFDVFPIRPLVGLFLKIIIAYTIVKVCNESYIPIYVNCIFIVTVISFFFWLPSIASSDLKNLIVQYAIFTVPAVDFKSYIIFNPYFSEFEMARNSGPFWEPGAFAGFLMIALIFNFLKTPIITERKNLVLILGILSTFSTTGYLALFLFIVLFAMEKYSTIVKIGLLIAILPISIFAFQELPFMKNKLIEQAVYSESKISYTMHRSRFTSAMIDFRDFQEYPLFGRGKFETTRFNKGVKAINRNNGTTDLLVIYGLIGFILYFTFYFRSFNNIMKYYNAHNKFIPYYFLIIILVLGFSENYFLLSFFWSLCFVGYTVAGKVASQTLINRNFRTLNRESKFW